MTIPRRTPLLLLSEMYVERSTYMIQCVMLIYLGRGVPAWYTAQVNLPELFIPVGYSHQQHNRARNTISYSR